MDIQVVRDAVNIEALHAELQTALTGQFTGISTGSYGVIVHVSDDVTPEQIDQATAIVTAHDASILTPVQIAANYAAAIEAAAHDQMAALPGWSTWTAAQCVDYIETNVTDLASAKVVLKRMAEAIVYLRNQVWRDLEEET